MGKIRLTGATSGYTELKAAEAAGNNTITLPTTNGGEVIVSDSSGNVNIDSGTFYVDASNNRVGIGTSSPVYLVDAQGGRALFTANSETYSVGVRNRASLAPNGNFWIGATNAVSPDMVFSNNAGNERMRITDGGNVGIGSTAPSYVLDVAGSVNNGIRYKSSGSYGSIIVDNSSSTGGGYFAAFQNGVQKSVFGVTASIFGDTSSDTAIFADTGSNIRFFTNGSLSERARIDTSGRLLVGTSSASFSTTVKLQGNNASSTGESRIRLCRGTASPANGDTLAILGFSDNTETPSAEIAAQRDGGTWSASSVPGRLVFSTTADGASSPTERLRIANTGAIGLSGANYGTSGQVLTSQGSGAAPQWATLSTGSMVFINSVTASNSASVAFTSGINSTYDVYMIQYVAAYGSASSELRLRVSTNGGSSYESSSYQFGTTISSISPIQFGLHIPVNDLGNGSGGSAGQGTIYIYSPARSNEYTAVLSQSIRGTGTNMYYSQGEYQVKNVVNAIQLFASSGNVSGVFRLYGIKNS